ncbi:MAG TPA: HAD-IA family hydrolase [Candidatus Saccharimonadales bacterium]|nr:HAD-IA family hydrolase [Candidatus Saccharimonadales bacterium]
MVKAIIFDCFGVLTTDTWKEFTGTLPQSQKAAATTLNHAYDSGAISKPEFLQAVQDLTGKQPRYVDDMLDNETIKNSELLAYIKELGKSYKIALLSNVATNWIREHFLTAEEQAMFHTMVFSFEIGATKPDTRMFQAVAERLGVEVEECVIVDDVERYCTAAEDLGMRAICYQDFSQMKTELEKMLVQ